MGLSDCVVNGTLNEVRQLLQSGADPNFYDSEALYPNQRYTPLDCAVGARVCWDDNECYQCVTMLWEYGARATSAVCEDMLLYDVQKDNYRKTAWFLIDNGISSKTSYYDDDNKWCPWLCTMVTHRELVLTRCGQLLVVGRTNLFCRDLIVIIAKHLFSMRKP